MGVGAFALSVTRRAATSLFISGAHSICSRWTNLEFGQSQRQAEEKPIEVLVRADDIKEEMKDMEADIERIVDDSTRNAKDFMKKSVILIFGPARQGKSTNINDLLEELGDSSRPAKEEFLQPCTRGVQVFRRLCTSWTTTGVEEQLLFFDTEGWEFGKTPRNLFKDCIRLAEKECIQPKILQHRLVLVCVLSTENRSFVEDRKFLMLLSDVCWRASKAAQGGRPVLLPVISKSDLLTSEEVHIVLDAYKKAANSQVGKFVEVREPIAVSNKQQDADGSRPAGREMKNVLSKICSEQLRSELILSGVKDIIETDLKCCLMEWEKEGIDAGPALVRRFLWVVARHRGLRIKNLYKADQMMSWTRASSVRKSLKKWTPSTTGTPGRDDWHSDPRREKWRAHRSRTSLSTPASWVATSAGESSDTHGASADIGAPMSSSAGESSDTHGASAGVGAPTSFGSAE